MQLRLVGRGAIAGLIATIIGIPLTYFTFGGGLPFLLMFNFYLLVICIFFGMILTSIVGSIQEHSGRINALVRMIIGGLAGVVVAFLFVFLIEGIFSIVCTGILSGLLCVLEPADYN